MPDTHYAFKYEGGAFEGEEMRQIENRLILHVSMSVIFVLEWVRVYDDYPILNVRVGEARYSTPIKGEKNKEKYSKKLTFPQRFTYF